MRRSIEAVIQYRWRLRRLGRGVVLLTLPAFFLGAVAQADISGPDETSSTAYGPLAGGRTYSGKLQSSTDVDYLYFYIARPNTAIHVSVANTSGPCPPPMVTYCPIWVTLLDSSGHQIGGDNSSAGTDEVDMGESASIDWTFPGPGKYFAYVQSDGEQPSYQLRIDPDSALASSLSSGSPPGGGAGSPTPTAPQTGSIGPRGKLRARHRRHRRHRHHHR